MFTFLILILVSCDLAMVAKAAGRVEEFDLSGALEVVRAAGECEEAAAAAEYLEGLLGLEQAFEGGGTVDSLREVRSAINALSRRSEQGDRRWEAASLALRSAAAASQQERGEMSLYLAEAIRVEALLLAAGLRGVPFITVHELAGDLWRRIHQFADARAAYRRAASLVGLTPRVRFGLARTADKLQDVGGACAEYRSLLEWWDATPRAGVPAEIEEARARVRALGCR